MAKGKQSMFEGHNGVQQSAHIRTVHYRNGNQGFNAHNLGGDTVPGQGKGAPLSNSRQQEVTKVAVARDGLNRFNNYEANGQGVLGDKVVDQMGGQAMDSPVPTHATRPRLDIVTKAAEVASYVGGSIGGHAGPSANNDQTLRETFPQDGVLGRG